MGIDIITLSQQCPGITVSIKLEDLIQANRLLLEDVNDILESQMQAQNQKQNGQIPEGEYITRNKTMEILGASSTTLWRWKQIGYLLPASQVGNKDMYRLSDVMNILEGKEDGTEL